VFQCAWLTAPILRLQVPYLLHMLASDPVLLAPTPLLPPPPNPACDRAELYKQYLMYSMSGDVVELPVGGVIRKKNSAVTQQAEMQRLSQLGDILGMSPLEVRAVQQDLASQAFKSQVRDGVRGGRMSERGVRGRGMRGIGAAGGPLRGFWVKAIVQCDS